jgi:DeoR family transcriptional regulator of aga operon
MSPPTGRSRASTCPAGSYRPGYGTESRLVKRKGALRVILPGVNRDAGDAVAVTPAEVRQARITALVEDQGFVRVADLAARFGVSTVTARSDLQTLETRGRLRRIRGGAVPRNVLRSEQPFEVAARDLADEKAEIGRHAAGLVADGDTVLMDVGTTTTAVAEALVARTDLSELTVVTSGLNVALTLERAGPRISVVVTGGTLRRLQHSLVNPFGTLMLERLNASIAFIGCNGVDPRGGVTNINLPEAEVKRAMLLAARRPIVVADATKLGEVEVAKVCDLAEVSMLVTDRSADPALVAEIRAAGCEVEQPA